MWFEHNPLSSIEGIHEHQSRRHRLGTDFFDHHRHTDFVSTDVLKLFVSLIVIGILGLMHSHVCLIASK